MTKRSDFQDFMDQKKPNPLEMPPLPQQQPTLRRALGVTDAAALIIGICIGAGIYSTPQIIAGYQSSFRTIILLWLVMGGLVFIHGLMYSELGTRLPHSGGDYVYISRSFGPFAGFMFGWAQLLIIRTSSVAGLALITADYIGFFVPMDKFTRMVVALLVIALLGSLNYVGIKQASFYQKISSLLKVSGLFALIAIGLILMHRHVNLLWTEVPPTATLGPLGNFITPLMLIFFTYGGYVRVGQVAEEIKKPRRDIPRSLITSLSIIILLYILINTVYHRLLGIEGMRGSTIVASDVATLLIGPAGAGLITILVIISTTSGLNANTMSSTRVYYAMAKDGLLFKWLDYIHPKFRTPSRAILVHCFWASVILLIKGNFETIITGKVFINFIFYSLGALAFFRLREKKIGEKNSFRVPWYPVLPALYLIGLLGLIIFRLIFEFEKSVLDIAFVASGIPFYFFWSRRSNK
ncbi:MAG: APC family permease [Candidatus Aminicenantaceae bacterium]